MHLIDITEHRARSVNYADNLTGRIMWLVLMTPWILLNVERTTSFTGHEKSAMIGIANLDRNYLAKDFEKYYNQPGSERKKKKDDEEVIDIESSTGYENPDKDEKVKERKELMENR